MSQVHVKEKLTLNINVMWSKVLCLYHSIHLIQTKLWIDFKHQVDCNTTFKKSDSTSNLYHFFLDAHRTHHLTKWLDFKVHHFHSGFPLPPQPLPDLSHLLKNYPKGQLSSVVKDVFCKWEYQTYRTTNLTSQKQRNRAKCHPNGDYIEKEVRK